MAGQYPTARLVRRSRRCCGDAGDGSLWLSLCVSGRRRHGPELGYVEPQRVLCDPVDSRLSQQQHHAGVYLLRPSAIVARNHNRRRRPGGCNKLAKHFDDDRVLQQPQAAVPALGRVSEYACSYSIRARSLGLLAEARDERQRRHGAGPGGSDRDA